MSNKDLDSQLNGELSSQLETAEKNTPVVEPKYAMPQVKDDVLKFQTTDNLAIKELVSY